tara:strand:- start:863 stop:2560 length:1698 start_codon:yes stop_codon:yes gene_type:complete
MAEFVRFDFPFPQDERLDRIWHQISTIRHDVYADELHQYDSNADGVLEDPGRHFIACVEGDDLVGYISLNPPESQPFRLTTYFSGDVLERTAFAACTDPKNTAFEVRGLTVAPAYRGQNLAFRLMRHALEFVVERGGTDIVAMGHSEVVKLYESNGLKVFRETGVQHGQTVYFPMHMSVSAVLKSHAKKIEADRDDEAGDDACYHGGQSWEASRFDFDIRDSLIVADVLDSPFPPCPEALDVIREQLERCCQESPPTQCEELIETIAEVRDVPSRNVAVSSGSSSLMFSLLPQLLSEESRVLLLSPMYGEYSHILQHVIGCHITYFVLEDANGFAINPEELVAQACEHDAVILVNPNSPTGVYCEAMDAIVSRIAHSNNPDSKCRMIWVDETYINYLPDAVSLEPLCASLPELVVCKSMSKCYALSGLRVAYAVSQNMPTLRRYIPPWAVSLPGQLAAVAALRNEAYYQAQYDTIHQQREAMHSTLEGLGFRVFSGVANYLLTYLPAASGFTSTQFIETCRTRGLFVRDAQNMGVMLPNNAVRFAVRSPEENERMLSIVRSILAA